MAASDYVPIFFKNRLHLEGRPQMSTRHGKRFGGWLCGSAGGHLEQVTGYCRDTRRGR
jgi:hypothetical protein